MPEPEKLIPLHGGYRKLKSFQVAQLISESPCASVPSSAEFVANATLSLLNLCCYLLDRQLETQAAAFEKEGGFTERLYKVRSERRSRG